MKNLIIEKLGSSVATLQKVMADVTLLTAVADAAACMAGANLVVDDRRTYW